MNTFVKKFLLLIITSTLLFSCKKPNLDKIATGAWNPNLAVPLAHANFDVYDVLVQDDSSDLVVINPNTGALALVYNGIVFSSDATDLVTIADLNQNENIDFSSLGVPPSGAYNGTSTANNSKTITINANGSEIHELNLKSGTLSVDISTDLEHDLNCVITFPDMLKNGVPVSLTVDLNYSGTTPHSASSSVDLSDVFADFTLGNTTFNQQEVQIETTITGTGQPINGTENIDVGINFSNLAYENAKGYFNQSSLGIPGDTVLLKIFKNATDGYFELVNPKVNFFADNSFGFPIRLSFSDVKTINVNTGQQTIISGYPSTFDIASASAMGETTTSEHELNTSNTSNLSSLVSSVPKYFVYFANTQSNPNGNVPPLNFITDESELNVRTEVELPLEGSAYGFKLEDTVDFNFNEDVSQLESVMFRLNIDNGFPAELKSQIVFLDENYNALYTVFNTPEDVVLSAQVDSEGRVNQHTKKITDIHLNETQIEQLPEAKYLLIKAVSQTLNGPSGQVVKIFDDYTVDLKLGLQVEGKVQL